MANPAIPSTDPLSANPIAVSLITGFLGSGKTTLLNYLLAHPEMDRTAVLINEFGEVGLDHLMVREIDCDAVLLKSGCICCTVQGELIDGLKELYLKRLAGRMPPFSRVVIETTGLADPLPIITCLMRDPLFKHAFRLDTLVTTVDAVYGGRQLDDHGEALRQAAVADRILITKSDLVEAASIARLRERLHRLNPGATLVMAHFGKVPPGELFGAGIFDPGRKSLDVRRWLNQEAYAPPQPDHSHPHREGVPSDRAHAHDWIDVNRHDDHIRSFCVTVDEPIAWDVFKEWYEELAEKKGDLLLRMKGIVNILGASAPFLVHGVQSTQHEPTPLPSWPDDDRRSRIVFITRDLERDQVEKDLRDRLARASAIGAPRPDRPPSAESGASRPGSGRWLNEAEIGRVFAALAQHEDRVAADALRLMLLTGASAEDARTARWEDIDLDRRVWLKREAPARERSVKPRPRRIPLGDAAIMLLAALRERSAGSGHLFPGAAPDTPVARLDSTWIAVAGRAGLKGSSFETLPPILATGIFARLAPDLTRSLLGIGDRTEGTAAPTGRQARLRA